MNPEAQRIAISKVLGFKQKPEHSFDGRCDNRYFECEQCGETQGWLEYKRNGKHPEGPCSNTRNNYPEDLNAMHEAECHLSCMLDPDGSLSATYTNHLIEVMQSSGWPIWYATANQRAKAFLKTLNLWTP